MKIKKQAVRISKQVLSAKKRQSDLLKEIDDLENRVKEEFDHLRGDITYAAQTYIAGFKKMPASKVDRTSNMLCGPFYISDEYPILCRKQQMLYPVLQLDLRDISILGNIEIGDGLLQLWCDTLSLEGAIRVIPRSKVLEEAMEPFIFEVPKLCFGDDEFDGFPLPSWFNLDPVGDSIDVIDACMPGPFESQLDGSDYGRFLNQILDKDLRNDLSKFEKIAKEKTNENLTFFGTYPVIQYSNSDTNAFCLLSISDWGSSGSAEIFYKLNPGGVTEFTFFSCVR